MIQGKSILAVVPARGGSKGILRKNICDLGGKPLIAWTIESAKMSKYIDRLIVSSDDQEIMKVAETWGCEVPFVRPEELAQDHTPGIEPVLHAIRELPKYDYIMVLQVTSPLRTVADIDRCVENLFRSGKESCASVAEVKQNPYWMYFLGEKNQMEPILQASKNYYQRQKLPKVYILNGAIYIAKKEFVLKNKTFVTRETLGYNMPIERSLDIDNEDDLKYIEMIVRENRKSII